MDKVTRKITYSAILLAFGIVSTMVFKTIPMGNFSFLRFSLTPSIVIFASIALGPLYGAVVGVFSDMIPAFLLPHGAYNFYLSFVYLLLGVLPYFLFKFVKRFPKIFGNRIAVFSFLGLLFLALASVFYLSDSLDASFGEVGYWLKPLILALAGVAVIGSIILMEVVHKRKAMDGQKTNDGSDIYSISFVTISSEALLMSVLKAAAFWLYFVTFSNDSPFSYWYFLSMLVIGTIPSSLVDACFVMWSLSFSKRFGDERK